MVALWAYAISLRPHPEFGSDLPDLVVDSFSLVIQAVVLSLQFRVSHSGQRRKPRPPASSSRQGAHQRDVLWTHAVQREPVGIWDTSDFPNRGMPASELSQDCLSDAWRKCFERKGGIEAQRCPSGSTSRDTKIPLICEANKRDCEERRKRFASQKSRIPCLTSYALRSSTT
jgi:hypothetical protein